MTDNDRLIRAYVARVRTQIAGLEMEVRGMRAQQRRLDDPIAALEARITEANAAIGQLGMTPPAGRARAVKA